MSATDDANPKPKNRSHRVLTIALAIVAGASVGAAAALLVTPADVAFFESRVAWMGEAPDARELPQPPLPGERASVESSADGSVLVVRAARAGRARELASELMARRTAGLRQLFAARDTLAARWGTAIPPLPRGTRPAFVSAATLDLVSSSDASAASGGQRPVRRIALPDPGPESRIASLLLGASRLRRDLVAAVPSPWDAAPVGPAPVPTAPVFDRLADVARAVDRRDDVALASALAAEARAEDDWFADGAAQGGTLRTRASAWKSWQVARAESLSAMASRTLSGVTPGQRLVAERNAEHALLELALRSPRPYDALVRSAMPAWAPVATPIVDAWERWLGLGALVGALAAALLAGLALALTRPRGERAEMFVPSRDPGSRESWLHVVAGPNPVATARAVIELAAQSLARGERVLVVDGSTRLKLHERFGREARWGLMECLLADMPVIGLVQYGGRPGFYLLAHGNAARSDGWAAIGQRLDDARPHFGRIVLALDTTAPRLVGDSLAGRRLEGWWAEAVRQLPRPAIELTERLGIAFSGMDLSVVPQVSLEMLAGRARALALTHPPAPVEIPALPEPPVAVAAPPVPDEPVVLDCDLQMQQRLRFLAWMRRVQSERRRMEVESVS